MTTTPTPRQTEFFNRLIDPLLGHADDRVSGSAVGLAEAFATATTRQASILIDAALSLSRTFAPPAVRPNRYPAPCSRCRVEVPAGEGSLTSVDGRWTTTHLECPETPATDPSRPSVPQPVPNGLHVNADGAIVKVYTTRNGRTAGKVLRHNSFRYLPGAVAGLSESTLMTAEQARRYGRETGTCCNCGETIGHGDTVSTLQSLAAGYGPVCARRHGWPYPSERQAVEILTAEGIGHPLLAEVVA